MGTAFVAWTAREQDRMRFESAVDNATAMIGTRVEIYRAALRHTVGLFDASEFVSRAEFRTYSESMGLTKNYPGVRGVGFSRRVPPGEKTNVVARARMDGLTNFHIWPEHAGEAHVVLYLEPMDAQNRKALGYDTSTEATRRAAMEAACDKGEAVACGKISLVQDAQAGGQAAFLMYQPVYQGGAVPASVEQRRQALVGFIYAAFRADDLFSGIFGSRSQPVMFQAFDGPDPLGNSLMHRSSPHIAVEKYRSITTQFNMSGRPWTLVFHATPQLKEERPLRMLVAFTGLSGVLITGVLFMAIRSQRRAHVAAVAIAGELRSSEQALRESEDIFRTIMNTAADAIITLDPHCHIVAVNRAAERIFGYGRGELVGRPMSQLIPGRHHKQHQAGMDRLLEFDSTTQHEHGEPSSQRHERVEMHGLRKNGTEFPLEMSFGRSRRRGKPLLTGILRDVTERAQAQQQVLRHTEELELRVAERTESLQESVRSLEGFSYTIAHDLRAPLRTIRSFAELLVKEHHAKLAPEAQDWLGRISGAVQRMDRLISDLLTYGQLAWERLPLERVALESSAATALEHLQEDVALKTAHITLERPLPDVQANPTLLHQVLTNLISNAIKFTAPATVPTIHISARLHEGLVHVTVADNGIGIAPEFHDRVFGVFERLHSTKEYPGTGIGLAIVKKAVEQMGGKVGVTSAPGQGCTFWFELPAAAA